MKHLALGSLLGLALPLAACEQAAYDKAKARAEATRAELSAELAAQKRLLAKAKAALAARADAPPKPATTPEALWQAYRQVHAGATRVHAEAAGRRLDALLSAAARDHLSRFLVLMKSRLPMKLPTADLLRYRFLGEIASVRREAIERATPTITRPQPDRAAISLDGPGGKKLRLEAVFEGTEWRFAFTPDLSGDVEQLFPTPPKPTGATFEGAPSLEAIAQKWCDVLNGGDGWTAYALFGESAKGRLHRLVARVGGGGKEDVVRILEKTLRDRQARGLRCRSTEAQPSGDRGSFEITYSSGRKEKQRAIQERGAWWLESPF